VGRCRPASSGSSDFLRKTRLKEVDFAGNVLLYIHLVPAITSPTPATSFSFSFPPCTHARHYVAGLHFLSRFSRLWPSPDPRLQWKNGCKDVFFQGNSAQDPQIEYPALAFRWFFPLAESPQYKVCCDVPSQPKQFSPRPRFLGSRMVAARMPLSSPPNPDVFGVLEYFYRGPTCVFVLATSLPLTPRSWPLMRPLQSLPQTPVRIVHKTFLLCTPLFYGGKKRQSTLLTTTPTFLVELSFKRYEFWGAYVPFAFA